LARRDVQPEPRQEPSDVATLETAPNPRAVVCAGVLVADHLCTPISRMPEAGELVQADELVLNIGGCASNAAVVLAKLGVRATLCGRVGDDVFGRFVSPRRGCFTSAAT